MRADHHRHGARCRHLQTHDSVVGQQSDPDLSGNDPSQLSLGNEAPTQQHLLIKRTRANHHGDLTDTTCKQ